MKNIILPTDFSKNAWNAIFTALKLYANTPCQFYLLHAYEPKPLNKLGRKSQQRLGVIYDSLAQNSEQELNKILDYLGKNHKNPNHSFLIISKPDSLVATVKELTKERDIDLICMGTQGATGAKEVFIGSNTVKVLKQIKDCPVLAVPENYNFQTLKNLVFPTDFSKKYEKYQLAPLTELASLWKPDIQVVHVALEFALSDEQKKNQKLLKERLEGINLVFHEIDFEVNVAQTLEKFISEMRADMIALVKYQHSFWEKIIMEPIVKKMTFHTKTPLLVLPE